MSEQESFNFLLENFDTTNLAKMNLSMTKYKIIKETEYQKETFSQFYFKFILLLWIQFSQKFLFPKTYPIKYLSNYEQGLTHLVVQYCRFSMQSV